MIPHSSKIDQIREAAEADLVTFIKLVHPMRVLGHVHEDLISWWNRSDAKSHQLCLLPRDHGKSAMIAYRVAWMITKHPDIRILYISATQNLAIKQLGFIKQILTSDIYRRYWPTMVNREESKREKWTETEISVDHPLRKAEAVRDPTVFTSGLTGTITGMHCDIAVMDDVVVKENAYTEEGREKVRNQYSLLSSIEGANAREWIVGTRYHPNDLYNDLQKMQVDEYDEDGSITGSHELYEVFERQVENRGDGTGEFLWPVQIRYDGKPFGFNREILARKRAQYLDRTQFRAQYYNDPNDYENAGIRREHFQYFDPQFLSRRGGAWFYKAHRLNITASIDFAFSLKQGADYTCIIVLGVDSDRNYYVLDIDRFKTNSIKEYFDRILALHTKWDFRKIIAETTAAQEIIVEDLKNNYIRPFGLALSVEHHKPTRNEGTKEERMRATLQPRYENLQVWHYRGGNTQILEDELVVTHSGHDDVKDALTIAMSKAVAPSFSGISLGGERRQLTGHSRFGGIRG